MVRVVVQNVWGLTIIEGHNRCNNAAESARYNWLWWELQNRVRKCKSVKHGKQAQKEVALEYDQLNFMQWTDNVVDKDVDEQPVQDLALNVDNVFQADDCDAFDSDVDEAPMAQTMFMANLSSADPDYYERASVSVMPLSTYINLGLGELAHTKLMVELVDRIEKYPKGIAENVLVGVGKFVFLIDFIIPDMLEDVKVPLILGRPFLSTTHVKIDVFKKRMELDLEVRLIGDTLVLNRSLDPLYGDYIELNDLNVPLELRRDQVDDLMPTIKEGKVIDDPMIDIIKTRNNESFDEYLNFCDFDWKIHIDCAYNLIFSYMIVVENIDGYRDQDMGDIILREPFCKASCVEARRIDGLITIHNGFSIWHIPVYRYGIFQFIDTAYWTSLEKKSAKLVKYRSSEILYVCCSHAGSEVARSAVSIRRLSKGMDTAVWGFLLWSRETTFDYTSRIFRF
ncbi:putative reverse transcriptase domain-containing protein [Tanacetum coccineum]